MRIFGGAEALAVEALRDAGGEERVLQARLEAVEGMVKAIAGRPRRTTWNRRIKRDEVTMRGRFFHGAGGVLSADIAVPEHEREVAFYSSVLTTGSSPRWRNDLTNNQGTPIIGLGARTPEYDALPLQWMPHVQVADIDASVARAVELGGRELMDGKGEDGRRQWSVVVDPAGAAFGLIPVVADASKGAGDDAADVGRIAWLSLVVSDVATMRAFYEQVVGWPDAAAMIRGRTDEHAGVPSAWIIGLPVGDLTESLRRARDGGGSVIVEGDDGRAVIRDPVGVCFGLEG